MSRILTVRKSLNHYVVCVVVDGEVLPLNDSVCRKYGIEPLPDKGALTYAASERKDAVEIEKQIYQNISKNLQK